MPKPGAGMPKEVAELVAGIPRPLAVRDQVVAALHLEQRSKKELASELDIVLDQMMKQGLHLLRSYQAAVTRNLIKLYLEVEPSDPERALMLIEKGFTSMGNQRKKRAGVFMEQAIKWLLERCEIDSEVKSVISGQCDLIVPSSTVLRDRPERAVVLEFKRTVRERWKEVRDEIARTGKQVWLLTLDDYISDALVEQMTRGRITLYVPETVFQKLKPHAGHLRSLKTLVDDLEPLGGRHVPGRASGQEPASGAPRAPRGRRRGA